MSASENRPGTSGSPEEKSSKFSFFPFLITFVLMFGTWVILSAKFEPLLIGMGLFSSFLVAFYFHDLLFPSTALAHVMILFRFTRYIPWLIWEIIKANFHLLRIVFHPRMEEKIDPHIIDFPTRLKSDISITTLANSITLTPGTITVTANADGRFRIHAIDQPSAQALPGEMGEKVANIFGEKI